MSDRRHPNIKPARFTGSMASQTVTRPAVSGGHNGSGQAVSETTVYDAAGRAVWRKDAEGFLSYSEFDAVTGALVKSIADVKISLGGYSNLPSGWTTPAGGGLHLVTMYELDGLGRTIAVTGPDGVTSYTVYIDYERQDGDAWILNETRSYPAWDPVTNHPTGPTMVSREIIWNDPASTDVARYSESLSISAAPGVTSGRPPRQMPARLLTPCCLPGVMRPCRAGDVSISRPCTTSSSVTHTNGSGQMMLQHHKQGDHRRAIVFGRARFLPSAYFANRLRSPSSGWVTPNEGQTAAPVSTCPMAVAGTSACKGHGMCATATGQVEKRSRCLSPLRSKPTGRRRRTPLKQTTREPHPPRAEKGRTTESTVSCGLAEEETRLVYQCSAHRLGLFGLSHHACCVWLTRYDGITKVVPRMAAGGEWRGHGRVADA